MRRLTIALSLVLVLSSTAEISNSEPVPRTTPAQPKAAPITPTPAAAIETIKHDTDPFVPNLGQWNHGAEYVARFGAMTMFLQDDGWTFTLVEPTGESSPDENPDEEELRARAAFEPRTEPTRGVAVRMQFAGGGAATLEPGRQLPGKHNYFFGNDPAHWRSEVPLYEAVRFREIQPGVDVLARQQDGHFEYDLILQPDAELERVQVTVEGIKHMRIDQEGSLVLETILGPVRMQAPPSWEEAPSGEKSPITCSYILYGDNRFGFDAPDRRPGWTLVVDPGLLWSTFLGGSSSEVVNDIAIDTQGNVTVAGSTHSFSSNNFPTTPGAFDTTFNAGTDVFVSRLSASGTKLVYSTFLGWTGDEWASSLALDASGGATVAGTTYSSGFPTTPGAFAPVFNSGTDAFVFRLSPNGASLIYSTFLGGSHYDYGSAVATDPQGEATVSGYTWSADFPTTPGAYATTGSAIDAFVTRLSPSGARLVYSTYFGGASGSDMVNDIAIDQQGATTITGSTSAPDFPTTPGAIDTTYNGGRNDAFVAQLSPTGSHLIFSTFLGGTGDDMGEALALDAEGTATIAGTTDSPSFPTTPGAFDTTYNGSSSRYSGDVFIARISPAGTQLVYSTFLGGKGGEGVADLALDAQGTATLVGTTNSTNFPTTPGSLKTTLKGHSDGFVTRLWSSGAGLVYSTLLGGTNQDFAQTLALDPKGQATVAGWTDSTDFSTTPGAFSSTLNGQRDSFVTRLDLTPPGITPYGSSSPGCTGPLTISVNSTPSVGNAKFVLACHDASPNAVGNIMIGASRFITPPIVLGIEFLVVPSAPFFVTGNVSSNSAGIAEFPLPIPAMPSIRGLQVFTQFVWIGPMAPAPCPLLGISATNALHITVQ